jgi:hypothetical protein
LSPLLASHRDDTLSNRNKSSLTTVKNTRLLFKAFLIAETVQARFHLDK